MKYYYWANALIGVNPAANCVLFTTDEATVIPTVTVEPTGLEFADDALECEIGGKVQLALQLTGSVSDDPEGVIAVEPDAGMFSVAATRTTAGTGNDPDVTDAVPLNSRTYVDNYGILHVQKSGLEADDVITVTAKSAYINPSGSTTTYTATAEITLTEPVGKGAKECSVATDPYITYTDVTDEATASE